jgi:uncharacterized membrane-anchored protein YitT (DUF2179 family)
MISLNAFLTRNAMAAALLFSIPAAIFLFSSTYSNVWLLYLGNMLFAGVVLWSVIRVNHRVHDAASLNSLFSVGIRVMFYGLLIASVLCLIMMVVQSTMVTAQTAVEQSPDNAGADTRGDLVINLFISTVLINAVLGALASALGSSVAKRNQKSEQGKPVH